MIGYLATRMRHVKKKRGYNHHTRTSPGSLEKRPESKVATRVADSFTSRIINNKYMNIDFLLAVPKESLWL